ncbi:MAG: tetratricopeptide repeat protein [Planctomycetaceae bacterium]|nr:tetratricopeptide repeat protein [Planctomycetaceae bacterium]
MTIQNHSAALASLRATYIIGVMIALLLCVGTGAAFAQLTSSTSSEQTLKLGKDYYDAKNYTAAITEWEKLLAADPSYPKKDEVWYRIADASLFNSDNVKVEHYLNLILSQKDDQGKPASEFYEPALFLTGKALFQGAAQCRTSDPLQAKTYATAAQKQFDLFLAEFPDSSSVPLVLYYQTQIAVLYLRSAVETRKYTELAQVKIPKDTEDNLKMWKNCRFYLAWALGQLGQEDQARVIFGEFISAKDTERGPKSLYELAHIFYRAGNYTQTLNELSTFSTTFQNDRSETWLDVQRLQAMCYYQMERYEEATEKLLGIVEQQDENAVPVADYIYFVLCRIKTGNFDKADELITWLEAKYASSIYSDGVKLLRAHYYAERGQIQSAVDLLHPLLGTRQNYNGTVSFDKRPFTAEVADSLKCGLTEEHFLRAVSLLAICYAKSGNMPFARQIYDAMSQVSNEMYGRYSSIRERTLSQLNAIPQSSAMTTTTPVITNSGLGTYPAATTSGTATNGSLYTITPSQNSVVQMPGGNNSLANRPFSPEEQDDLLKKLEARAKNAEGSKSEIDEVINELHQLLNNWSVEGYNSARAAVLRGELLFQQDRISEAVLMFTIAYNAIPPDSPYRDTQTFEQAAFRLGLQAAREEEHKKAAQYYSEAYATTAGKQDKFRAGLLYRWGSSLLYVPGQRRQALWCFNEIYEKEITSKYWSHAALQLAIDDYFTNYKYVACETIIDELIAMKPDKAILDRVLYLKGELALLNKQWDIAATSFDAISAYTPDSPFVGLARQRQIQASSEIR